MKNMTTIPKKEVNNIATRTALITGAYDPKTTEECAILYKQAPEIAAIAEHAVKDGLQGKALLNAKKLICDDEWNAKRLTKPYAKKWQDFCITINCSHQQASYLLDFAGYQEKGGEIETAAHYREVKKITETNDPIIIDQAYNEAGGKELKTAKEVKTEVAATLVKNPYELFYNEHPEYNKEEPVMSDIQLGNKILSNIPNMNSDTWKTLYRSMSKILHPDVGGSDEAMAMIASVNNMYKMIFKNQEAKDFRTEKNKEYAIFCAEHGYKNYGI